MSWSPGNPGDEEKLRRALHEEASRVVPDPDAWQRIRERTVRVPWWRRPVTWALATATAMTAATVAVGVVLSTGGNDQPDVTAVVDESDAADDASEAETGDEQPRSEGGGDDAVVNAPSGEDPGQLPDDVPEGSAARIMAVPAYFLTETPSGPRLAREFRGVRERDDSAETALRIMAAEPVDPDYDSPWHPDTGFDVSAGDPIEVDLSLPDGSAAPDEVSELAVQQLVYTVQAALQSTDPVRILVDGEPVDELWGVDVSDGLTRAPQLEVRQLVQINDPGEGVAVTSPVRVTGEAALFEATYVWRVERDGTVVEEGSGMADEGQRFAAFSFEAELEPGTYTVIVSATDPSGGEGPEPMSDSRTFTVTSS